MSVCRWSAFHTLPDQGNLAKIMPSDYIHLIDVYETYFHCNGQLPNCHRFQTINIFVSMENTKMSIVRKRTWIPPFFIPSKLVNAYNETNM